MSIDAALQKKSELERGSLELAEDARTKNWAAPSFVAELLMGRVRTQDITPYPCPSEADRKEGDAFLAIIDRFFREHVNSDETDRLGQIPDHVMQGLAKLGAFGMKIPKEYGGLGLSATNYNRALALVSSHCGSTMAMLSAHQGIGVPQPLLLFGTQAQRETYLPRLARGEISAFALTEPDAGSDPAGLSTHAELSADGSHYILSGTKLWCTNGAIAKLLVVMAQTAPKNVEGVASVGGRVKKQITAFIVETDSPGFEVVHRSRFVGLSAIQNAVLKFDQVRVPKENVIGGEGMGLKIALVTLNAGRLGIPAGCIGAARECLKTARIWSKSRTQWGLPIGKHEAIGAKLGFMASHLYAMEAMTWMTSAWVDQKSHDIRIEAAMTKLFCSEIAQVIVDETLQIRGGRGYETAASLSARGEIPLAPIERIFRDVRVNRIVEGTSEILKLFISREILDQHLKVAGEVLNSKVSMPKRLKAAVKALNFYAFWYPKQWLGSLVGFSTSDPLKRHLSYAKRTSHRLARTLFHLMLRHGPKLEGRQLQLGRVVDIGIDLFAIFATSAKAKQDPAEGSHILADAFCQKARARIEDSFRAIRAGGKVDASTLAAASAVLEDHVQWLERQKPVY